MRLQDAARDSAKASSHCWGCWHGTSWLHPRGKLVSYSSVCYLKPCFIIRDGHGGGTRTSTHKRGTDGMLGNGGKRHGIVYVQNIRSINLAKIKDLHHDDGDWCKYLTSADAEQIISTGGKVRGSGYCVTLIKTAKVVP